MMFSSMRRLSGDLPTCRKNTELPEKNEVMKWYVVNTRVNSERMARRNLDQQGYSCFLPVYRKTVRHARKVTEVLAPLFPSYLFVEFDPEWTRWRPINGTAGVRGIVSGSDGRPSAVPMSVMRMLQSQCRGELVEWRSSGLEVGQKIVMTSGPFTDFLGEVQRLDGPGRVRLLLEAMGNVPITAPLSAVQPLEMTPSMTGLTRAPSGSTQRLGLGR
ncbi:transcription termination/antitermination protein NusG [Sphingomonas sp. CJ20]